MDRRRTFMVFEACGITAEQRADYWCKVGGFMTTPAPATAELEEEMADIGRWHVARTDHARECPVGGLQGLLPDKWLSSTDFMKWTEGVQAYMEWMSEDPDHRFTAEDLAHWLLENMHDSWIVRLKSDLQNEPEMFAGMRLFEADVILDWVRTLYGQQKFTELTEYKRDMTGDTIPTFVRKWTLLYQDAAMLLDQLPPRQILKFLLHSSGVDLETRNTLGNKVEDELRLATEREQPLARDAILHMALSYLAALGMSERWADRYYVLRLEADANRIWHFREEAGQLTREEVRTRAMAEDRVAPNPFGHGWRQPGGAQAGKGKAGGGYQYHQQVWPGFPHTMVTQDVYWNAHTGGFWKYVTPTYWPNWRNDERKPCEGKRFRAKKLGDPNWESITPGTPCRYEGWCAYFHRGESVNRWVRMTRDTLLETDPAFVRAVVEGRAPTPDAHWANGPRVDP